MSRIIAAATIAAAAFAVSGCVTNIAGRAEAQCAPLGGEKSADYQNCVQQVSDDLRARNRRTAGIIAAGLGGAANSQPYPRQQRVGGQLVGQFDSGMNRVCVYDELGSRRYVTIGAAQLCPIVSQ